MQYDSNNQNGGSIRLNKNKLIISFIIIMIMALSSLQPVVYASIKYEYYNTGDTQLFGMFGTWWSMQSFTVGAASHSISSIKFKMCRYGTPGTLTISIRNTDGSGYPTGNDLTSGTINANDFSTSLSWYEIPLTEYVLSANTKYVIILRVLNGDNINVVQWSFDNSGTSSYISGNFQYSLNSGSTWSSLPNSDGMFEVYGNAPMSITIDSSLQGSGYVMVDNSSITTPHIYNWFPGTIHIITANSPVNLVNGESQYIYSNWSDSGTQSHNYTVTVDATVTANFQLQYYLTVMGGDSPTGQGWYDNGVNTNPSNLWIWSASNNTRTALVNWQLDGSNQNPSRLNVGTFTTPNITMSTYHTVNFISTTQYYMNLLSTISGLTVNQSGSQTSDDWYDSGTDAQISATTPQTLGDIAFNFDHWYWSYGGVTQSNSTDNPFNITMGNYVSSSAYWSTTGITPSPDVIYPQGFPFINLIIAILITFIIGFILLRK